MLSLLLIAALPGQVQITLDRDTGAIEGELSSDIPEHAALVSYLAALREPYRGDDIDRLWDYPASPDGSRFTWLSIAVDGQPIHFDPIAQAVPLQGRHVSAHFRAQIPRRYGPLGRVGGQYLLTAVSPFIVVGGEDRRNARAPEVDWEVAVVGRGNGRWLEQPTHFKGDPTAFFLAAAREGYETLPDPERSSPLIHPSPPPRRFGAGTELTAHLDSDPAFNRKAAQGILEMREWMESALAPFHVPMQRWLVGSLRRELASCSEDTVVIGEEMFHSGPVEALNTYYRFAIARVVFGCAFKRAWHLSDEDADALGAALAKKQRERFQEQYTILGQLLRPLTPIPDIDDIVYSPKMLEAGMLYTGIDESFTRPPEHNRFFHDRPRGKILYEKLRDRIGNGETDDFFLACMLLGKAPLDLGARWYPRDLAIITHDFFGQYPVYDLSFETHADRVTVHRRGPGSAAREPIEVEADTQFGGRQRVRLSGDAVDDTAQFPDGPVSNVQLDPDQRIVEKWIRDNGLHPRYNDADRHSISLSTTRLSAAYGTAGAELTSGLDFSFRRQNDYHNLFGIGAYTHPSGVGGLLRYSYQFGPRVNADVLRYRASAAFDFDHLNKGYAGAPHDVFMGTTKLLFEYDDRINGRLATHGVGFNAHADLGIPVENKLTTAFTAFGAGVLKVLPLSDADVLSVRGRADASFGQVPLQAQYSIGGRTYVRALSSDFRLSPMRAIASVEYRHELVRGHRSNLMDLLFIDGIEGALFADAAAAGDNVNNWFARRNQYYDAGFTLYILLEELGFNPGVIAIDCGTPLNQAQHFAFNVLVSFSQSFSQF